LGNKVGGCELDTMDSGYGSVAGSCKQGNETWGSVKDGEYFE